jgi:hypothetical protein
MSASTPVLAPYADPCPELNALVDDLYHRLAQVDPRTRRRKALDDVRYRATLTALTARIAMIALAQIPPHDGIAVAFDETRYIGSDISPTHLRSIARGLDRLDLTAPKKGFYNAAKPAKSFTTRIRHTTAFTTLTKAHGLRLNALVKPPAEVIALSRPVVTTVPEDVASSATTVRRYNDFVQQFDLSLPQDAWNDLFQTIQERGTNGKGDKLVHGFSDASIYLTRRFAETYERGGRLYDGYWQNMPKAIRKRLIINGKPTVELDFSRVHPTIIRAELGLGPIPDPYDLPGYSGMEATGKLMFNRLLNSRGPVRYYPKNDSQTFRSVEGFNQYRDAMITHLDAFRDTFGNDYGARLQKRDSELALRILDRCIASSIPVYPVHDSFITQVEYEDELLSIMKKEFRNMFGIDCVVK